MCSSIFVREAEELGPKYVNFIAREFVPALLSAFDDELSETKRAASGALCCVCRLTPCSVRHLVFDFTKCLLKNLEHPHVSLVH